jgi:hypothetical protein
LDTQRAIEFLYIYIDFNVPNSFVIHYLSYFASGRAVPFFHGLGSFKRGSFHTTPKYMLSSTENFRSSTRIISNTSKFTRTCVLGEGNSSLLYELSKQYPSTHCSWSRNGSLTPSKNSETIQNLCHHNVK